MKIECCICLEDFSANGGSKIQALKCGHLFHENCIHVWMESNASCPQCRQAVKPDELYFIHLTSTVNSSRRSSIFNSSVCQDFREINDALLTAQESYRNEISELKKQVEKLVVEKQKLVDENYKLSDEKEKLVQELKKENVVDRNKRLVAENEMLKKERESESATKGPKLLRQQSSVDSFKNVQSIVARAWKK